MKLTPWFNGKQKPVRVGLYQRTDGVRCLYAWWNGRVWSLGDESIEIALWFKKFSSFRQEFFWRGVMK